jgi:cyclopropane-fatty-acyl-phospholipid synthase
MSSESMPSMTTMAPSASAAHHAHMPTAARIILKLLGSLQHGALLLKTPDGALLHYGDKGAPVTLELKNWNVFGASLRAGDIGFAESYIAGDWTTSDLTALMALLARNRGAIEALIYGSWWGRLVYRVRHLMNRNTRAGSRKNIHAHYDIGNAFYALWLDSSMSYSSALYTTASGDDLAEAQSAKYCSILEQLKVKPGDRVLEIGCGWGGFAEIAARDFGAHVTGLTLSSQQLAYANTRMEQAGLAERVDLRLCDYRDHVGEYDAIASIEMFEAVGESFWPSYFQTLARSLKPGAQACVQTIVIADDLFERYRNGTDFIQQYIFPGGMLASPSVFERMAFEAGLCVTCEFAFGADYARTLAAWRESFHAKLDAVRAQGFDDRFIRTWEFYLSYCEAAFLIGDTDVMHFTLTKC